MADKSRLFLTTLLVVVMPLAGCGGADARKARHLEKGREFLAAQNYEKARVEFRNALQIAPNDSEARYDNGAVDEKLGNPREAAQFYQGAIDTNSDNVRARTALGRLYLFGGSAERALEVIKPALDKHPEDAGLLTVRAAAAVQAKDLDGALGFAEHAVKLAPTSDDAVAVLAGIYTARQEPEKARALLERAIKDIPDTVDLRLALAQLDATLGQDAQVEALLLDLVRIKPDEQAQRLRLAQFYARSNHLDEAEKVLRDAVKALPAERNLKIALIDFLTARRSRAAATEELNTMIAGSPKDYELKFAQARFYEQGNEMPQAQAVYRQVITQAGSEPAGMTARNRLATLLVQTKDVAGAERLIAEVLAKTPRDNDALILRGNLELSKNDAKDAIVDLRAVLRDQPNATAVMRTLARAHLANGEPALAEETMRRAVDGSPKDVGARLDLAQLLAQLGKPEQAKPLLDELVKQQPDNVPALDTQFKVAMALKDLATAQAAANALVAAQPKLAVGFYYQGMTAEAETKLPEAARLYGASLDVKPEATEPLEALVRVLVKLKREPEALKRLDETGTRFPAVPAAFEIKGEVLLEARRPEEAQLAFKTAIEREPKWWTPYRGLAYAQVMSHDEPGAIATLQAGVAAASQPEALEVQIAAIYETQNKIDEAIGVYEAALHRDAHAELAANNLAMLLITHNTDQASLDRAKLLTARFSASKNAAYLDTYGWVLYKRGEMTAAVAALRAALSKTPDSPVSLYHLGMAQASAGEAAAARDNLKRSLDSGQRFSGMDEAKATLDKLAVLGPTHSSSPKS
jgi:tetratricopeptide (TPR) repeat protein